MMKELAHRHDEDGVITVTFTREDKLNAVNYEMLDILEQAARDLETQDHHRVLVITAEGRYFTSGRDIADVAAELGRGTDGVVRDSNVRRQYRTNGRQDFFDYLEVIEKPIVLAAQAACLGIGVEMSASCDFRLASDAAWFALPEVENLALIPGSGAISRLTRLIGQPWIKWMAMAGQRIDAQQALSIGYVQAVYPAADFVAEVQRFARHLASLPREAMGLAKLAIGASVNTDLRTARDLDRLVQASLFRSPEHRAKLDAFAARRHNPDGG
jgi:enoyl-CoA hydratase/carnithine racemase